MACLQGEQATWDNVLTWLSSTTSKAAIQECAVALLSAMASRALTPNLHLRSHQLWSIPVLQLQPVTRPTMALICAAFAGGVPTVTHACMDGELQMGKCMTLLCILHMCCCTCPPPISPLQIAGSGLVICKGMQGSTIVAAQAQHHIQCMAKNKRRPTVLY